MEDKFLEFEILNKCPVCESINLRTYRESTINSARVDEADFMITDKAYGKIWDLSFCKDCTHVFANPCRPELLPAL